MSYGVSFGPRPYIAVTLRTSFGMCRRYR